MTTTGSDLEGYLSADIRGWIEERYYARVNTQARLDQAAHDPDFLTGPRDHMALISDHGVIHVRDVARQVLQVLRNIT